MAPLPQPRGDAACIVVRDKIYVFDGGMGSDVRQDALVLAKDKWSALLGAELPAPRLCSASVSLQDSVYLLGGLGKAGDYQNISNTFWRWSPRSEGWEVLPPLPAPGRVNHGMAELGGDIYVFGGAIWGAENVENVKEVYKYCPATQLWTRLPDLPVANRAWWALGLGARALLLGGYTNHFAREVYIFDPKHALRLMSSLPQGVADIKFFRIRNLVVGAGGESGPGVRGHWTFGAELPIEWVSNSRRPRLTHLHR